MTGLERNGDVVEMASYAPLLAHVEAWQWTPDAIWFDNLRSYGTPNYYVQSLFANNAGTRIVPVKTEAGIYVSASLDERTGELVVKAVNRARARPAEIVWNAGAASGMVKVTTLEADLKAENSFEKPKNVAPVQSRLEAKGRRIEVVLPANSVTVYRVGMR